MTEPPRFREGGGEDLLAASLLDTARAYRRPPSSRARIAKVLGVPIAVSVAAPVMAAASSIAAKMVIVVSAAVIATGGGVVAYRIHTGREARRAGIKRAAPVAVAVIRPAAATSASPMLEPARNPPRDEPRAAGPDVRPRSAAAGLSFAHPRSQRRSAPPSVQAPSPASETVTPPAAAPVAVATAAPGLKLKMNPAPPAPPVSPQPFAPVARVSAPATSFSAAAASTPAPSAAAPAPAPQQVPLAREIQLLDAAERAERRGDHGAALVTLDEYARAFPDGALLAESTVLRIAALLSRGDRGAAEDVARAFLARSAPSPLTARVRSMLSKSSTPNKELP